MYLIGPCGAIDPPPRVTWSALLMREPLEQIYPPTAAVRLRLRLVALVLETRLRVGVRAVRRAHLPKDIAEIFAEACVSTLGRRAWPSACVHICTPVALSSPVGCAWAISRT